MKNKTKQQRHTRAGRMIVYSIGNSALVLCALLAFPKITEAISSKVYRKSLQSKPHEDEDWGPVIEKIEK